MNEATDNAEPWHTSTRLAQEVGRDPAKDTRPEWVPVLDEARPAHPTLEWMMGQSLLRIYLLADGATSNATAPLEIVREPFDRKDAKQRALANAPEYNHTGTVRESAMLQVKKGDGAEIIAWLRKEYFRCRTNRERLTVIKDAQLVRSRIEFAPDRSKIHGTLEWKQAIADDPRSCRALETVYGVSYRTIARIKKTYRQ